MGPPTKPITSGGCMISTRDTKTKYRQEIAKQNNQRVGGHSVPLKIVPGTEGQTLSQLPGRFGGSGGHKVTNSCP